MTPPRPAKAVANPVQASATRKRRKTARTDASCVVIYARVSTDEQVTSGAGIDAQISECQAYAARLGWEVVDVIIEGPVSGTVHPTRRPGFARAVALLEDCTAGTLLVRRTDRVSRRLRHFLDVADSADAGGWSLATTDGKVDTGTAAGRLQVNVMASVAEYEREVISERTREGLAAKRAQGVRLGRPSAIPKPVLDRIVREWGGGRGKGLTLQQIATRLNADGIPNPTGSAAGWVIPTVHRALKTAKLNAEAGR
jgi:DNA invertase Pin-like site-specific DNA recombinase